LIRPDLSGRLVDSVSLRPRLGNPLMLYQGTWVITTDGFAFIVLKMITAIYKPITVISQHHCNLSFITVIFF